MNSILSKIAAAFTAFASIVVKDVKDEAVVVGGEVAADVSNGFLDLVEKVGEDATKFVHDLFADGSLSGSEKANLATTQLVDLAAQKGIDIASHDATAIIKNAYLAVKEKLGL